MPIEVWIHTANVFYLLSYLIRQIFLLRVLTIFAGLLLLPYYFFVDGGPLTPAIIWNFVFTAVNLYQLIALFKERRPVKIDPKDHAIYEMSFSEFTLKQFASLLSIGERKTYQQGDLLMESGQHPKGVHVIVSGKAILEAAEHLHINEGAFVGELSYVTKTAPKHNTSAHENLEVIHWDNESLTKLLSSDPELKSAWQGMISARLAAKLEKA